MAGNLAIAERSRELQLGSLSGLKFVSCFATDRSHVCAFNE
jgi:hypothetical protein